MRKSDDDGGQRERRASSIAFLRRRVGTTGVVRGVLLRRQCVLAVGRSQKIEVVQLVAVFENVPLDLG